jgi:hypothetical protein
MNTVTKRILLFVIATNIVALILISETLNVYNHKLKLVYHLNEAESDYNFTKSDSIEDERYEAEDTKTVQFLDMMKNRHDLVSHYCESTEFNFPTQERHKNLFLQRKYNLMWCPVFKAASSNWLNYFNTMSNVTKESLPLIVMI